MDDRPERPSNIPVWAWGKAMKAANCVPDGSVHKPSLVIGIARELVSVHESATHHATKATKATKGED